MAINTLLIQVVIHAAAELHATYSQRLVSNSMTSKVITCVLAGALACNINNICVVLVRARCDQETGQFPENSC
jgi:hypothetical protein